MLREARDTVSLEQRIAATLPVDDLSLTAHAVASLDLPQASGTASALTAILASSTVRLAANVHVARANSPAAEPLRQVVGTALMLERHLHAAARDDAAAWNAVVQARRAPAGNPEALSDRIRAVDAALMGASEVPLRIARLATDVLALAAESAEAGDHVTSPDAWAGASIAYGSMQAALGLVRGNLAMLADSTLAAAARAEAHRLTGWADGLLDRTRLAVRHVAG